MSLSSICIVLIVSHSLVGGIVPQDFQVELEQDEFDVLRVHGFFGGSPVPSRPSISVRDCGDLELVGMYTFQMVNRDHDYAVLDVTDTVMLTGRLLSLCIGYNAALTRTIGSIVYMRSSAGMESIILRPSNVSELAYDNQIGYTNVQQNDFVYGKSIVGGMTTALIDSSITSLDILRIDPTRNDLSCVSEDVFWLLINATIAAGGNPTRLVRRWQIRYDEGIDCLERLVGRIPNLHFILSNDEHSLAGGLELVFHPDDYITASDSPNICNLNLRTGGSLLISGLLARRLGGIHFDYAGSRIGLFDPL